MYGTTIKNYNVNKASKSKDDKKSIFSKKLNAKQPKKEKKLRDTRYVNVENNNDTPSIVTNQEGNEKAKETVFSRKEFPIPSVIITVLCTMMFFVIISGIVGI